MGLKNYFKQIQEFPPQAKFIVGNEACERFSFYGMRSILVVFMTGHLLMKPEDASAAYHLFAGAVYLLPLIGAYLSDKYLGKYKIILYLSLVYCLGHLTLALWDSQMGLFVGLGLISIGAGGIKPCVSAYVGDQFSEKTKHLIQKVFDIFYFSVNFGSFFATLLIPVLLVKVGPQVAFGIPGVLMAIATFIFWLGRKHYVNIPPSKTSGSRFMPVVLYSLYHWKEKKADQSFLDVALKKFTPEEVDGVKAVVSIMSVFATVSLFWALFEQHASSWVLQGQKMNLEIFGMHLEAAQIQALNPILVMVLIPLFGSFLYPQIEKWGIRVTPLRKMSAGMILAGFSFVGVGLIQAMLDAGATLSVAWQLIPYIILTSSEVMVSITGLEFAYTQAPKSMKSTVMSFWLLTVFVGNLLDAAMAKLNIFDGAMYFYFYAGLMFVVSLIFVITAMRYRENSFLATGTSALVTA